MKQLRRIFLLALIGAAMARCAQADEAAVVRARQSAATAGYTISKVQRWLREVALAKIEPGMQAVEDELWSNPTIPTRYGMMVSTNLEVNGEQLQVLARLYSMTGENKYLDWAERIADYYLLQGDFVPERLRDHGCEIIGGLGLLLAVESVHRPEKAQQYAPHIRNMLDTILEKGTNADGFMHDSLGPAGRLSDGWGYNYVAYLCCDMTTGTPVYTPHIEKVLHSLAKPEYRSHAWEGCRFDGFAGSLEQALRTLVRPVYRNQAWEDRSLDGFADSVEGALYLLNRLPVPEACAWADREVADNIVFADDRDHMWGTMKLQSNAVRTAVIHALMHTQGLVARPWRQGLLLGACSVDGRLYIVMKADTDWSGRLVFDIPRHRSFMGFSRDWPRINTLPEWYTVEPDQTYAVRVLSGGSRKTCTGRELREGLPVALRSGEEQLLLIERSARSRSGSADLHP